MDEDLRQRIEEAQAILEATSTGEWEAKNTAGELAYVVNLAGDTPEETLVVAGAIVPPAAHALVHCHNHLPQLLADIVALMDWQTTNTTPPPDKQCATCGEFLEATFQTCPRCGATV